MASQKTKTRKATQTQARKGAMRSPRRVTRLNTDEPPVPGWRSDTRGSAFLLHPGSDKPSQVRDRYRLYANRQGGDYPAPTARSGKWLIFVPRGSVDELWHAISEAVKVGPLGSEAKV